MPSIDERIVAMAFENAKFEAGVAATMATLAKLDATLQQIGKANSFADIEKAASQVSLQQPMSALDKLKSRLFGASQGAAEGLGGIEQAGNKITLETPMSALDKLRSRLGTVGLGASEGFGEIEKSANSVDLSSVSNQADEATRHFDALRFAAIIAFGTIVHRAVNAGLNLGKALTLEPVMAGFHNYETQINAVQTIMANTGLSGKKGLGQVQGSLDELNTYANQTVYNFSEMAKNIGTFTAAGVDLKTATASIKGIANLAALSGSNSQQASTAMYQLSQAIASGKVGLQDWNSVVNAGMGGKVFQKALADTAQSMGTLKAGSVGLVGPMKKLSVNGGSFRESIMAKPGQTSWLTSDVLTKTLEHFTGDMSDAQLKAQGFSESQIKAVQAQAKAAVGAATNIKTISQLMDALKEEVATAWGAIFKTLFGDIFSATKLFSGLHVAAENALTKPIYALNKLLQGWAKLGGRVALIEGLKAGMKDLSALIKPVQTAFRNIFPAQTAKGLLEMTKNFRDLMVHLKPSAATVQNLQRTFEGLFAVLHIGWTIVKGVFGVLGDLLGLAGHAGGGFLGITASLGGFLKGIDTALTKGGALTSFFRVLGSVLQAPAHLITLFTKAITGLFGGGFDMGKLTSMGQSFDGVRVKLSPFAKVLISLQSAWGSFVRILGQAKTMVSPWLDNIGTALSNIGTTIADALKNMDFNKVMSALQTGFVGGIFIVLKKAITGGSTQLTSALGGINKVFGALTGNLEAMQQKVKAQAIMMIAASIGVLAASTYVLSTIDPKRLTSALTAMAVGLGELMGSVKLMTSGMGFKGVAMMPVLAAGLIGVATSTVILAAAMKIFATMKWEGIAKGMAGVAGGLVAIGIGMKTMGPTALLQGPALILIATGMNLLALAVKQFASIKSGDLAKGLYAVFFSLSALLVPLGLMGPEILLIGPGLVAAAFAMNLLAGAVAAFGALDPKKMFVGVAGMAAAMLVLAPSVTIMALALPGAVALAAASVGVLVLAGALGAMGSLSIGAIAKGLVAMAGSLVILAAGLTLMIAAAPGTVALLGAAAALAILAPTLAFLGTLNWGTIFKGLMAMALVMGTMSAVGLVASAGLEALGIALLPLAGVFVLTAGAVFLFAKALSLLGDSGGKGIAVMITAITTFIALLPTLAISLVKGLLDVVSSVADLAPKVVTALGVVLDTIIAFVITNAPKFGLAIGTLVDTFLSVLVTSAPKLFTAGTQILLAFLSGLAQNIGQITVKATTVIVNFLNALAGQAPALAAAGVNFLVQLMNGIASKIGDLIAAAVNLVGAFIGGVFGQIPRVLLLGAQLVGQFILGIFNQVGHVVTVGLQIITNIITGIGNAIPRIVTTAGKVIITFINALGNESVKLANAGFDALIKFLHGLANAIRTHSRDLVDAGIDIASAIVDGITEGLGEVARRVIRPVIDKLFSAIPGWARKILGIHSPSKVFHKIGSQTMQGLANGLTAGGSGALQSAGDVATSMISSLGSVPDALNGVVDVNPTITPVLDLSQVKGGAKKLGDLTSVAPITASANYSYGQASAISAEQQAVMTAKLAETAKPTEIKFEQNNHSPEALSPVEVYRHTRNLLAQAKGTLDLVTT